MRTAYGSENNETDLFLRQSNSFASPPAVTTVTRRSPIVACATLVLAAAAGAVGYFAIATVQEATKAATTADAMAFASSPTTATNLYFPWQNVSVALPTPAPFVANWTAIDGDASGTITLDELMAYLTQQKDGEIQSIQGAFLAAILKVNSTFVEHAKCVEQAYKTLIATKTAGPNEIATTDELNGVLLYAQNQCYSLQTVPLPTPPTDNSTDNTPTPSVSGSTNTTSTNGTSTDETNATPTPTPTVSGPSGSTNTSSTNGTSTDGTSTTPTPTPTVSGTSGSTNTSSANGTSTDETNATPTPTPTVSGQSINSSSTNGTSTDGFDTPTPTPTISGASGSTNTTSTNGTSTDGTNATPTPTPTVSGQSINSSSTNETSTDGTTTPTPTPTVSGTSGSTNTSSTNGTSTDGSTTPTPTPTVSGDATNTSSTNGTSTDGTTTPTPTPTVSGDATNTSSTNGTAANGTNNNSSSTANNNSTATTNNTNTNDTTNSSTTATTSNTTNTTASPINSIPNTNTSTNNGTDGNANSSTDNGDPSNNGIINGPNNTTTNNATNNSTTGNNTSNINATTAAPTTTPTWAEPSTPAVTNMSPSQDDVLELLNASLAILATGPTLTKEFAHSVLNQSLTNVTTLINTVWFNSAGERATALAAVSKYSGSLGSCVDIAFLIFGNINTLDAIQLATAMRWIRNTCMNLADKDFGKTDTNHNNVIEEAEVMAAVAKIRDDKLANLTRTTDAVAYNATYYATRVLYDLTMECTDRGISEIGDNANRTLTREQYYGLKAWMQVHCTNVTGDVSTDGLPTAADLGGNYTLLNIHTKMDANEATALAAAGNNTLQAATIDDRFKLLQTCVDATYGTNVITTSDQYNAVLAGVATCLTTNSPVAVNIEVMLTRPQFQGLLEITWAAENANLDAQIQAANALLAKLTAKKAALEACIQAAVEDAAAGADQIPQSKLVPAKGYTSTCYANASSST
ncbi:Aste57867_2411 [Aphanomyces stellatus]|uniref:Aste57867_2411 protein n=1 Tax=Aphanomyces stellatus TaxID=120398 RepID=A0A485K883_9STRA|nr:hypothetical protein As57867_002405 [Aphanomyces stellatus]VFT79612.1 Aste57867_2411 [Aphanomyces stellatus]